MLDTAAWRGGADGWAWSVGGGATAARDAEVVSISEGLTETLSVVAVVTTETVCWGDRGGGVRGGLSGIVMGVSRDVGATSLLTCLE